jgi:aspartate/methionine/tyrosine aminotransferase
LKFAHRTDHLRAEGAYAVLARANALEAEGHEVIHLEIGQPDFPTLANVSRAGKQAIDHGRTRYNPPDGVPDLKAAVADHAGRQRDLDIEPRQVVVAPGAKPLLFMPTLALVEPGDEVIYPDPGFPTYREMILFAGGVPVPVPLAEEHSFSFDLRVFDRLVSDRTRMVVLNSPGNPTGGVIPRPDLEHIAEAAQRHDFWVMSDEIYSRIQYLDGGVPTIAALPGMRARTVIVDGFSKTYAMTGWRLGYGIMPAALAERLSLMLVHAVGCTAHFTQFAGVEALTGPQNEVDRFVEIYRQRRDRLVAGLNELPGVSCRMPEGAFYAFPNVRQTGMPCGELASRLLQEAHVAVLPGTDFGTFGEGYLRISYANSLENIERALARMARFLG